MGSLLMIDDDDDLCGMMGTYLTGHGLRLSVQHDAVRGLRAAMEGAFDLVILDVMLPELDGLSLLRKLRESSRIGVILLTARANDQDRIHGFDAGADDYVTKPFNPRELLGRIKAILRRSAGRTGNAIAGQPPEAVSGGLRLSSSTREAFYLDRAWHLTETEYHLLTTFLDSPGKVISREALVAQILQREFHPLDRSLDMHISRLRKKLDMMGYRADPIKTIRSSGYLFTCPATHF